MRSFPLFLLALLLCIYSTTPFSSPFSSLRVHSNNKVIPAARCYDGQRLRLSDIDLDDSSDFEGDGESDELLSYIGGDIGSDYSDEIESDLFDADESLEDLEDEDDVDSDVELDADPDSDMMDTEESDDSDELADTRPNWRNRLSRSVPLSMSGSVKRKVIWEDRYEDDPLKSNGQTVEMEKPKDRHRKTFAALGLTVLTEDLFTSSSSSILSPVSSSSLFQQDLQDKRSHAWIQHMQWSRRTVLCDYDSLSSPLPLFPVRVTEELTLLSRDSVSPLGQLLFLRSNSSEDAKSYLDKEPLSIHGALRQDWKLFEMQIASGEGEGEDEEDYDLLRGDLCAHPFLLVCMFDPSLSSADRHEHFRQVVRRDLDTALDHKRKRRQQQQEHEQDEQQQQDEEEESRVSLLALLLSQEGQDNHPVGIVRLFSARSNAHADRLAHNAVNNNNNNNNIFSSKVLFPVNQQDISGLHHAMPRTFGEKTELDKIHFQDPEDLLQDDDNNNNNNNVDIASLSLFEQQQQQHYHDNRAALLQLSRDSKSFRYERLSLKERYEQRLRGAGLEEEESIDEVAENWNSVMNKYQKAIQKSVNEN